MNGIDLIKSYMTRGLTPKGIVMSMIGNNPMLSNLCSMAENGDTQSVEAFARNMLKQRGLDYDTEMANMKRKLNIN